MDWKNLFLSADGRIGRQTFWIGWLMVLGANVVLGWIPIIGFLVWAVGVYASVCLYSKRLHDIGKSGWLQVWPWVISLAVMAVCGMIVGGTAAMGAFDAHNMNPAGMAAMGALGLGMLAAFAVIVGFTLWVGLTPGDPGANKYGEPRTTAPITI